MKKLFVAALLVTAGWAAQAQSAAPSPLKQVEKVGEYINANTPWAFRMVVNEAPKKFDFIQFVNFGRTFGTTRPAGAYAISQLEADEARSLNLEISHNDRAVVWLNGQQVYSGQLGNAHIEHRERNIGLSKKFPVKLNKGSNQLLVYSQTAGNKDWIVYIQPEGATIEFSEVKGLALTTSTIKGVTPQVSALSNFLVAGPLKPGDEPVKAGSPVTIGHMFTGLDGATTWGLPRVEVFGDLINSHPLWGTYYTYNYHAAGVAWAMQHLAKATGRQEFNAHSRRYCDWIIDNKPFIAFQVFNLNGFRSAQHHQFNTPLLDFTTAPAMPFVQHLIDQPQVDKNGQYKKLVDSIMTYVQTVQVRLPDGTFTRETPVKYTTWVDDMFMGIPFLVHAAQYAKDPKVKAKFYDEAAKQVLGFNKNVYNKQNNLYHHAQYSTGPAPIPFWSRANGWGIWAASEVLLHLPKNHPSYKQVLAIYRNHIDGLVKHQDAKTGFWHQILPDPSSYEETSGTAIFTMAIARGINNGWLDAKKYRPYAEKGWQAVSSQIKPDGQVENICVGTMSSEDPNYYKSRPKEPNDSHGLLGVLFAGMEMEKLQKGKK